MFRIIDMTGGVLESRGERYTVDDLARHPGLVAAQQKRGDVWLTYLDNVQLPEMGPQPRAEKPTEVPTDTPKPDQQRLFG